MRNICFTILSVLTFAGCIENFRFDSTKPQERILVVDGFVSNISTYDYQKYPTDPRKFTVKLSYSGDVGNTRNEPVLGAHVYILDDSSHVFTYTESAEGEYIMEDITFKANQKNSYKIQIELVNGEIYESEWAKMPSTTETGQISFEETTKEIYETVGGNDQLRSVKGIDVYTSLTSVPSNGINYYKWEFIPSWVYEAPLTDTSSPVKTCWVTDSFYLKNYEINEGLIDGYKQKLFFLETRDNSRLYLDFTFLLKQYGISERYYEFLKDIQEQQTNSGSLFSPPPSNVGTNLSCINCDAIVYGFFAVVSEELQRWYLDKSDLSYTLPSEITNCNGMPPQPEECYNCLEYRGGGSKVTNIKPTWWR